MKPPPLPAACQPLSNEDFARLKAARPRLWTKPGDHCLTCLKEDGHTYQWYADSARQTVATYECDCRNQWLLHLWLLNAGIGLNYQRLTWEDIATIPAHVVEQVLRYAENAARNIAQGRNVVLWSKAAGTGKTLLLTLLLKELMKRGVQVHFSQFNEIIDLFTDSWRDKGEREQWNRRVRNVDALALDDIGKENKGRIDMVESMIDQVLRARVTDALPTFITTNRTPEELAQGYGSYVRSLLSEALFIEVTGIDFRSRRLEVADSETSLGLSRPITVN